MSDMKLFFAAAIAALAAFHGVGAESARTNGIVCLTFDDRNWERWAAAIPLFEKYGAHASFFPHGSLDRRALDCLKALHDKGHTVGLHTQGHRPVPECLANEGPEAFWESQIKPQLDALATVGIVPKSMAYPISSRSEETDAFLAKRGFRHLRGGNSARPWDGQHRKRDSLKPLSEIDSAFLPAGEARSRLLLCGTGIGEDYNTDIDDICAGIRRAAKNGEAVVFYSHDISPDAVRINMKTAWLERILETARDEGMAVLGLDEL